jgi:hypothetical protein
VSDASVEQDGVVAGGEYVTLRNLRAGLEAWLRACGDSASLDEGGELKPDGAARGWTPPLPPTTGLRRY